MSDNSRKRSRKTKLEPRDCELEVIENDDEEIPSSSTSKSMEEDQELAELKLLPKLQKISHEDTDLKTPKHQFDIDIKVEQFDDGSNESDEGSNESDEGSNESDEGCLNIDEGRDTNNDDIVKSGSSEIGNQNDVRQSHNDDDLKLITNEHNYEGFHDHRLNDDSNNKLPNENDRDSQKSTHNDNESDSIKKDKDLNMIKSDYSLQCCLDVVSMSEDRLREEIETFSQKTTSAVDKHIEILLKNNWRLSIPHIFDSYDIKINEVLHTWKVWCSQSRNRENILMYKCYICNLAWWHLYPFRLHIRSHEELLLTTECSNAELNIIAHKGLRRFKKLTPEGDCWQCQKSIEHFSCGTSKSHTMHAYRCHSCQERFRVCTSLKKHEGKCQRYLKQYFMSKICEPSKQCDYCGIILLSEELYMKHMVLKHTVRSDLFILNEKVKYHDKCKQEYINMYFHSCPALDWNYKCDFCESKFATSRLAMLHRDLGRPMNCLYCNKYLKKECMQLDHLLTHTSDYIWLYMCKRCPGVLFTEEAYIRDHRLHNGYPQSTMYRRMIAPMYCLSPEFAKKLKEEDKDKPEVDNVYVSEIHENAIDVKSEFKNSVIELIDDTDKEFEEMELSIANAFNNFKPVDKTDDVCESNDNGNIDNDSNKVNDSDIIINDNDEKVNNNGIKRVEVALDEVTVKQEEGSDDDVIELDEDLDFIKETEELELELSKVFKASKNITGEIVDPKLFHEEIDIKQEIKEEDESSSYEDDIIQFSYEPKLEVQNNDVDTNVASTSVSNTTSISGTKNTLPKLESDFIEVKFNNSNVIFKPDQVIKMEEELVLDDNNSVTSIKNEPDYSEYSEEEWDCVRPKKVKLPRKNIMFNKVYTCIKCNFSGVHRDYRIHIRDNCEYRKRKTRPLKEKRYRPNPWKMYKCSRCLAESLSLNSYVYHLKMHGLPENTCPKCGLLLPSEHATIEHVEQHIKSNYVRISLIKSGGVVTSRNDFMHQCLECQATVAFNHFFNHWEMHLEFNKVVKIETEMKEVDTGVSTLNEENLSTLDQHLLQKVINDLKMRKHMRRRAEGGRGRADRICVVCDKHFDRLHDIKVHLVQHLLMDAMATKNGVFGLLCQICGKELKNAASFKEHLRHHGSLPVYRCLACKRSFSDSSNFAKHKKIHNLMVLICDICNKKFRSKYMLIRHLQEHMVTNPIECEICHKIFYTTREYNKHHRMRHEKSESQFKCVVCNIGFPRLKLKWDHMWHIHNTRKVNADCPVCGSSFRKLISVKRHMKEVHNLEMSKKLRSTIIGSNKRI